MTVDLVAIGTTLISKVASDVALGAGGILGPVLSAYGLTMDTSNDPNDLGELVSVKWEEQQNPPDGICIQLIPIPWEKIRSGVSDQVEIRLTLIVKATLKDYPGNPISGQRGKISRFLTQFTAAIEQLFGPASLGVVDNGWAITSAFGDFIILNPWISVSNPAEPGDIQGQALPYCELTFTGFTYNTNP